MMVKSAVFVIFSSAFVFTNVLCKPAGLSGPDPLAVCYSLDCPEGTAVCGKHSEISVEDRTKLNVQIRCYGVDGTILKSKNMTEGNPFGPGVYYKGTKLSSVINMFPSYYYGPDTDTPDVEGNKESNAVPETGSGPKSEVEDLNSK